MTIPLFLLIYTLIGALYTWALVRSIDFFSESNIKWRIFVILCVFIFWPVSFLWDLWCLFTA